MSTPRRLDSSGSARARRRSPDDSLRTGVDQAFNAVGLIALAVCACTSQSHDRSPMTRPDVTVIAHRGASGYQPEHTFAAYDLALEMGADYIEQDLQMTADGILVVLHDETLDRTGRGPAGRCTGPVRDKTLAELRLCEVGSWFLDSERGRTGTDVAPQDIPTLDEVLARYGRRTRYYIETKQPEAADGMEEALLRLLARHDLLPRSSDDRTVLVQSFSAASLRTLHARAPTLPLVQLFAGDEIEHPLAQTLATVAEYAVGIGPSRADVTGELTDAAHRHGLVVHPYTVNDRDDMVRLIDEGVDGMFTDYPDRLHAVRRDYRSPGFE